MENEFNILAGEPCLDLINTLDNRPVPEKKLELLPDYASFALWAEQAGVISRQKRLRLCELAKADSAREKNVFSWVIELRESLYRIFDSIVREQRPARPDLEMLAHFLAQSYRAVRFRSSHGAFELEWQDGEQLESPLWPIVRSASNLLTSPDLKLVRECAVESCRWLFVDRSKNHSRRWCDMKICGNRTKAKKFYSRGKENAGEGARATQNQDNPDLLDEVQQRRAAMPPILLGKNMADELGAKVGSVVLVTSPQGELTPFGMVPKYSRFRVAGIFDSGFYDYDSSWSFVRLSDAQRLFSLGNVIQIIEFKIDDIYKAAEIGQELEKAAGAGFQTTNWMELQKPLFHALRLERLVTFITVGLIVFVAALNILISLTMMVMEKNRDIAVLMSMGTRKSQVRKIFIAQGALIGIVGTVLGLVIGYMLSWVGGHYHLFSLSPEVYSIDYVPFAPRMLDGIWVAITAIGTALVATIYPSWSAAKVLPAEALRYE